MSVVATSWVYYSEDTADLDPTSKLILAILADCASKEGTGAYPSRTTIAKSVNVSVDTVDRRLRELAAQGLIERGDQALVEHFPKHRRPVVYNLILPVDNSSIWGRKLRPRAENGAANEGRVGPQKGAEWGRTAVRHKPKDNPRDKPRGGARVVAIHPQVDSRPLCPACDRPIALASGQTVHESGLCIQCRSGS